MGVPVGTPMSMPGWQASHGRGSQNGEVIGPFTGQIIPEELSPWTGPVGAVAPVDEDWACAAAWAASACCWAWSWDAI